MADAEREYYLALEEQWNAQRQEMEARDAAKAAANADVRQLQQQLREQKNLIKNLKIEAQLRDPVDANRTGGRRSEKHAIKFRALID